MERQMKNGNFSSWADISNGQLLQLGMFLMLMDGRLINPQFPNFSIQLTWNTVRHIKGNT